MNTSPEPPFRWSWQCFAVMVAVIALDRLGWYALWLTAGWDRTGIAFALCRGLLGGPVAMAFGSRMLARHVLTPTISLLAFLHFLPASLVGAILAKVLTKSVDWNHTSALCVLLAIVGGLCFVIGHELGRKRGAYRRP